MFNLVSLQGGVTALLGASPVPAGPFRAARLVIDETQSEIVLKNGTVLTCDASPFVKFPSGAQSGIKVQLAEPIEIVAGQTVVTLIDFDLTQSFVMRRSDTRTHLQRVESKSPRQSFGSVSVTPQDTTRAVEFATHEERSAFNCDQVKSAKP